MLLFGTTHRIDFYVSGYDFGTVSLGDSAYNLTAGTSNNIAVSNLSQTASITIDSIWADRSEFTFTGIVPFTLLPSSASVVAFRFLPSSIAAMSCPWHAASKTLGVDGNPLGIRNGILSGNGVADVAATFSNGIAASVAVVQDGHHLRPIISAQWYGVVKLELLDLLGRKVFAVSFDAMTTEAFYLGELPSGAYFYRLNNGADSETGKIVIER